MASVLRREADRSVNDVAMDFQDDGWQMTQNTGAFVEFTDNPDSDNPVRILLMKGPGATLVMPSNSATKRLANTFGGEINLRIKKPAGQREEKKQAKSSDFRDSKNTVL